MNGHVAALAFDFEKERDSFDDSDPAVLYYKMKPEPGKYETHAAEHGGDVTGVQLLDAKGIHVPPLDTKVPTPDGSGTMRLDARVMK